MTIVTVKRLTVKLRKQTMVSSRGEPAGRDHCLPSAPFPWSSFCCVVNTFDGIMCSYVTYRTQDTFIAY